jgi:hypothetical protein
MQLAIDDAQQDRITVGQAEGTPNVSRHLQPTSAHQFASLCIHVSFPAFVQIIPQYTFFVKMAIGGFVRGPAQASLAPIEGYSGHERAS